MAHPRILLAGGVAPTAVVVGIDFVGRVGRRLARSEPPG